MGRKNKTKICDKKKTKICDKVSEEDRISQLPDHLISEILTHLSSKDVVRTSVLSTRWRHLWQCVPELDLDSHAFSCFDAFMSFVGRFVDSPKELLIHKLQLSIRFSFYGNPYLTAWIGSVGMRRIQHLDFSFERSCLPYEIPPLTLYTCETLVHLRLHGAALVNPEFVFLPCLKIMHLESVTFPNGTTFEIHISGCPVLEDLTIIGCGTFNAHDEKVLQVRSQTLKRIYITTWWKNLGTYKSNESCAKVVIDAPLLQCLKTRLHKTKNFHIINSGFSVKLDIDVISTCAQSMILDILTDISRVRDLVIGSNIWKGIFLYLKSGPVLQFRDLSSLNARFSNSDLVVLPTLLESCPKLESLTLELVALPFLQNKEILKMMFSTVPQCLVSSLKLVELKRSVPRYEGEMELVRYFLKNSTILEKLKLHVYYSKKAESAFRKEVLTIPRCSSACEIHCSFIPQYS